MKILPNQSRAGFTLVELMIASTVAVIMFGGMLITLVAQQRGFAAALYQMDAQGDESRVMGYLSRDLRQATAVTVSAGGTQVTLTVPIASSTSSNNSPGFLNVNLGLPLLSLLSTSGSAPSTETISYYRQGTAIIRDVGGVQTQLSSSATQFQVNVAGTLATAALQFQPCFSISPNSDASAATQETMTVYLLNGSQ